MSINKIILTVVLFVLPFCSIWYPWDSKKFIKTQPIKSPWKVVFQDDFNGKKLDDKKRNTCFFWWVEEWWCTLAWNSEQQRYQKDDVILSSWKLVLRAQKRKVNWYEYTAGMLASDEKFNFKYWYVEAKVKLPKWKWLWPAFWLITMDKPNRWKKAEEIDILEFLWKDVTKLYQNYFTSNDHVINTDGILRYSTWVDFTKDYIKISALREPWLLVYFINWKETIRYTKDIPSWAMQLILNLAIWWPWAESPEKSTKFPNYFIVDYVKVLQRDDDYYRNNLAWD